MADGARQAGFGFHCAGVSRLRGGEIVVDLFAGGGGASEALRQALGRDPDICINHDEWAIGMHAANHPLARHLCEDVWHADPRIECAGRPVGWLHASPDCTHFSQAKGGQPRSRATRSLSWVVLKWVGAVRPRCISLENVEQILKWGQLVAKRCKTSGRVLRLDGTVAAHGERVPIDEQFLVPDKRRAGRTWRAFVAALRGLGYAVEWRKVRACDHGAGTSRLRLFMVARCDGEAIRWPEPTHGPGRALAFVTAADCIDWSIPCPSIFTRKKPLADATMRRIARGIKRYVIDAAEPFIVPGAGGAPRAQQPLRDPANMTGVATGSRNGSASESVTPGNHQCLSPCLTEFANASRGATWSADEPLRTQCAQVKGGHFALATAILAGVGGRAGDTEPRPVDQPGYTTTGKADCAIVAATLLQAGYGDGQPGKAQRRGIGSRAVDSPMPTITVGGSGGQALLSAFLEQANGGGPNGKPARARGCDEPVSAITGTGSQQRLVTCTLSPEVEAGALRVAAFFVNYYGNGQPLECREPLDTVTTRDRLALVTVTIKGQPYVIVDIGLRMLRPLELYRAQGFPAGYIIDRTADGRTISGTRAVRMVGNSVSPPPLRAIASANLDAVQSMRAAA